MPHVHAPVPMQARRWKGRRLIGPDEEPIGAIVDVYAGEPGHTWGLVRLRRLPPRRRVVPLDDARSTDHGVVVPFDRATVYDAPAIEPGPPSGRETERVTSYYFETDADAAGDDSPTDHAGDLPAEHAADPPPATTSATTAPAGELAAAEAEARYREEQVALYRAKTYGPRPTSAQRMRELERARDGAEANVRRLREPRPR